MTDTSSPTATDTLVPTETSTPAPVDSRAVIGVDAVSNRAGELSVSWNAPSETPVDYRISWAPIDENFKTWTDLSGNAFPTSPSYMITGLDHGVLYKVSVRARYGGSSGPWTEPVEALVMDETIEQVHQLQQQQQVIEPPTDTPVPPTNTPVPPTDTPVPTNTSLPPTNTPVPLEISRDVTNVHLTSSQPGELTVTWNAPSDPPHDYRVMYSRVDEDYKTWRDSSGNAFPTSTSITLTGLDQGVRYKVKVRARYNGSSGDWSQQYEAEVASSG